MIVVTKFKSPTCAPCKVVQVSFLRLQAQFAGQPVEFRDVDITEQPEITEAMDVRKVPTVIITKDGAEAARFVGALSYNNYESAVQSLL